MEQAYTAGEAHDAFVEDMHKMRMGYFPVKPDRVGYEVQRRNIELLWTQWAMENQMKMIRNTSEESSNDDDDDVKVESVRTKMVQLRTQ